jgi:hypothetical protein
MAGCHGRQNSTEEEASATKALAEHLRQVTRQLPPGFTAVAQPPFVVIGDEGPDTVRMRAETTVKFAVDRLRRDFFRRDPDEVIDIWLFRDAASYTSHTRSLFNDTPSTPFGYYSATHHALIMNIETGGGTLVHEIVHPYMRANFPACPAWFNEGMGSLYEQSADRAGHIVGLTNWRLAALQDAIRQKRTMPFRKLMAMGDSEFYGGTRESGDGDCYAQARYLCYYLQEKGLLVNYYREFSTNAKTDPTGHATLKRVLGEPDMDVFQKRWESFVLGLQFP